MKKLFLLATILLVFWGCTNEVASNSQSHNVTEKQKGAHVFGFRNALNPSLFDTLNIDWITIVPFGFQPKHTSPEVTHRNKDSIQIKKGNERWMNTIKQIHDNGFQVFLKPHIWMHTSAEGKWRSDIFPTNEEDWKTWAASYRSFILRFAEIAEKTGVEMFCIGAECTRLTLEKPEFWKELIIEIREVYKGKITYAANWYKEYENIDFWDQLDYIGIQAYFPLTELNNPNLENLKKGWKPHLKNMEILHKKYNKQIIFTELGYKSRKDAAIHPWEWIDYENIDISEYSEETQINCYQSFFDNVWYKEWFSGVHIWQFRNDYEPHERFDLDFTPLGKGAEEIIRKGFRK